MFTGMKFTKMDNGSLLLLGFLDLAGMSHTDMMTMLDPLTDITEGGHLLGIVTMQGILLPSIMMLLTLKSSISRDLHVGNLGGTTLKGLITVQDIRAQEDIPNMTPAQEGILTIMVVQDMTTYPIAGVREGIGLPLMIRIHAGTPHSEVVEVPGEIPSIGAPSTMIPVIDNSVGKILKCQRTMEKSHGDHTK